MNMKINLHAPGGGRTTTHESLAAPQTYLKGCRLINSGVLK